MPRSLPLPCVVVAVLTASLGAQCQNTWSSSSFVPGVQGRVECNAWWDPDGGGPQPPQLVLGGDFSYAGNQITDNVVMFAPDTGTWTAFAGGANGDVLDLLVLADGSLLAAGAFTEIGGVPASFLARNDGTGWQPFAGGTDSVVHDVALAANGDVVAVGRFLTAGSTPANRIARWNGSSWSPLGSGLTNWVRAVELLDNDDIVVGGTFSLAGGMAANGLARWDGVGWQPFGVGVDGSVEKMLRMPDGALIVAGSFSNIDLTTAFNIARWDGTSFQPIAGGLTGAFSNQATVHALAVDGNGHLVAGGTFAQAGGVPVDGIARWDGTSWSAIGSDLLGTVYSVAFLDQPELLALGSVSLADDTAVGVTRFDGNGWRAVTPGTNERVLTVTELRNGDLAVGGVFTRIEGTPARYVARWDGSRWHELGNGLAPYVRDLVELPNGDLVACGDFDTVQGQALHRVARWNGSSWSPMAAGFNATPSRLHVLANGDLVAVGFFTMTGGAQARHMARWDGSAWVEFGGGADAPVRQLLETPTGELIAAGGFTTIGGVAARGVASWNGSTWTQLGAGLDSTVGSLVVLADGDLLAGCNGLVAALGTSVARWDGEAWSAAGDGGITGPIYAVAALPDGDFVVGGNFGQIQGQPFADLARWNGSGWDDLDGGLGPLLASEAYRIVFTRAGELVVVGQFWSAGGQLARAIVRRVSSCPADVESHPAGCSSGDDQLEATALAWSGGTARFAWSGPGGPALLVAVTGFAELQPALVLGNVLPFATPGCVLHAYPDILHPVAAPAGTAAHALAIPSAPALVGAALWQQTARLEWTASSFADATTSNALRLTIGAF